MKGHTSHHRGVKHHGVHHHHPRAAHAKGGKAESPMHGEHDEDKSPSDVYEGKDSNVVKEAREHKHGGRAKRKHGGHLKHVGHVHGHAAHHHAGRKPRKSGGKVGADTHPLTSAHKGTPAKGHSDIEMD